MTKDIHIDGNRVLAKIEQLYPVHFSHALAEVKAEMLAEQLASLEADARPGPKE